MTGKGTCGFGHSVRDIGVGNRMRSSWRILRIRKLAQVLLLLDTYRLRRTYGHGALTGTAHLGVWCKGGDDPEALLASSPV